MIWMVKAGFCKAVMCNCDILFRKESGSNKGNNIRAVSMRSHQLQNFVSLPFFISSVVNFCLIGFVRTSSVTVNSQDNKNQSHLVPDIKGAYGACWRFLIYFSFMRLRK